MATFISYQYARSCIKPTFCGTWERCQEAHSPSLMKKQNGEFIKVKTDTKAKLEFNE